MAEPKKQLLPLTGMRFFLALWVVVFHQPFLHGYSWMSAFPMPLPSLFNTGYLAVGVFFTLSGFVLSYNYPLDKPWSLGYVKSYAVARFSRIYPAYSLGLVLSAPWVAAALARDFTPIRTCAALIRAGLAWTLLQAWFPPAAEAWNAPGWSLSVEAFFYCCFPFLGVALWRISRPRSLLTAGLVIWAASIVTPLLAVSLPLIDAHGVPGIMWTRTSAGLWVNFIKFTPLLQIPQFCMGVVMGRVYYLLRSRNSALLGRGYWFYLPGILLEVLAIVAGQSKFYPFLHNGLLLPLHSLVILGFALEGGIIARFLSLRPLVFLGNASYSMYIFHAVIAEWMSDIAKRLFSTKLEGLGVTALYVMVVIAFSSIVFKSFEEPVHRSLKRKLVSWFDTPRHKSENAVLAGVRCPN
jgi:peptidoglycan/LPS O-acetylase OafA/YrhL